MHTGRLERRRLKILLAGEEGAGLKMLKVLAHSEHEVAMVLTSPPETRGSAMWAFAEDNGFRVLPAKTVKDEGFAATVRQEGIDLLLNVHSLYIIKSAILAAPSIGCFNMHPGPLPRYAGMNAPSWAILRGERRHGVTIHHMLAGIDTGPIAYQSLFDLEESDTALSVGLRCVEEGLKLMAALVRTAAVDPAGIPVIEQDLSRREYFGREIPEGGMIPWDRPAAEVNRFIRAFCYHPFHSPWGHPRTKLGDLELSIVKASVTGELAWEPPGTVARGPAGEVRVACADAWLELEMVKVDGKRVETGETFGSGERLGGVRS